MTEIIKKIVDILIPFGDYSVQILIKREELETLLNELVIQIKKDIKNE